MLSTRTRLVCVLLFLLGVTACQTTQPRFVPSPDVELSQLLLELKRLRGGDLETRAMGVEENEVTRELRELALTHPRHVPTLVANAAVAYESNDSTSAQKYLDQALRLQPENISATLLRVRIAAESGNLPYALRKLKDQIQLAPGNPDLHETRAGVQFLLEDYEQAAAELDLVDRLSEDEEDRWRTEYHRGLIAEALGQFGKAQEYYGRSRELNPEFEPASHRWTWLENSTSDFAQ